MAIEQRRSSDKPDLVHSLIAHPPKLPGHWDCGEWCVVRGAWCVRTLFGEWLDRVSP
jgi:hypothetical protein